jgi:hypothetical protein
MAHALAVSDEGGNRAASLAPGFATLEWKTQVHGLPCCETIYGSLASMYLNSWLLGLRLGGSSVLNQLSALLACLCGLGGATLLYRGFSIADASQTMELAGGASLLTLGLMLFWPVLKNWLEMKRCRRGQGLRACCVAGRPGCGA